MLCPLCGRENSKNVPFCDFCGCATPEAEPATPDITSDDVANPYAVGARTTNALLASETEARDVPSNILAAIKMCVVRGGLKGRSSRAEFWSWIIFVFILLLFVLTLELTEVSRVETTPQENAFWEAFWNLAGFSGIVVLLLTFTLSVRRFHDVNFIDETTDYLYGSLKPLEQSYFGKIDDLDKFLADREAIWYVGTEPEEGYLEFPRENWRVVTSASMQFDDRGNRYQILKLERE